MAKIRLLEILKQEAHRPLREQKEVLLQALQDHHNGSLQRDDITFIGVKL
ncbi:MAG: hypothetical protein HC880_06415 [Bacteroidia bacterium]|nr:hypothetical protein [Bacteroidia bacterium]